MAFLSWKQLKVLWQRIYGGYFHSNFSMDNEAFYSVSWNKIVKLEQIEIGDFVTFYNFDVEF